MHAPAYVRDSLSAGRHAFPIAYACAWRGRPCDRLDHVGNILLGVLRSDVTPPWRPRISMVRGQHPPYLIAWPWGCGTTASRDGSSASFATRPSAWNRCRAASALFAEIPRARIARRKWSRRSRVPMSRKTCPGRLRCRRIRSLRLGSAQLRADFLRCPRRRANGFELRAVREHRAGELARRGSCRMQSPPARPRRSIR